MPFDIFARIGDIKGDSLDATHKNEIVVLSFAWGVTNAVGSTQSGSGAGAGKPVFQDLSIVHAIDRASPKLMEACATGKHLPEATITQRKAGQGQQDYLVIKLKDVIVTGVQLGSAADQPGSETLTLRFGKVDYEFKPQKPDGSLDAAVHFGYDVKGNRPA